MADNFLEQRMEDLHRRPVMVSAPSSPLKKGEVRFFTGKRRIAVLAGDSTSGSAVASKFATFGHNVALITSSENEAAAMRKKGTVRVCTTEEGRPASSFFGMLAASWLGIDIAVILDATDFMDFCHEWSNYKTRLPIPSDYAPRIILADIETDNKFQEEMEDAGISIVRLSGTGKREDIGHFCVLATLPGSEIIKNISIG